MDGSQGLCSPSARSTPGWIRNTPTSRLDAPTGVNFHSGTPPCQPAPSHGPSRQLPQSPHSPPCSSLGGPLCADEPKELPKRKPWSTSKITGSPEPPPKFKSVRVFPDVKFDHPDLIARCPGTDRLFIGEQDGVLYSVKPGPGAKRDLFFDLKKEIQTLDQLPTAKGVGNLYGLVFHPKFTENRYCYVCYTLNAREAKNSFLPDGTRVSRFTVPKADPPRIDPASEEILITFQGNGHNGGDLHFGPDGMLYISTGDGRGPNPPDLLNTGQDCSDLLSSILRIDVDRKGEPAGVSPRRNYAVPKDNPFVGMKDVRPEIWAFGFRNPWRMSFDRKTGELWVGDVGWELWEMVHKVEKGGNYGWSIVEGRQPAKPTQKIGPTPIRPPTIELSHTIAASVTGGYVYRRQEVPGAGGGVCVWRLGDAANLGRTGRERPGDGDAGDREADGAAVCVRRGQRRRNLLRRLRHGILVHAGT